MEQSQYPFPITACLVCAVGIKKEKKKGEIPAVCVIGPALSLEGSEDQNLNKAPSANLRCEDLGEQNANELDSSKVIHKHVNKKVTSD